MHQGQSVALRAGKDDHVSRRDGYSFLPALSCDVDSEIPDVAGRWNALKLGFELTEHALFGGSSCTVPQLEPDEVAKDRIAFEDDFLNRLANRCVAIDAKRLDPGRRID